VPAKFARVPSVKIRKEILPRCGNGLTFRWRGVYREIRRRLALQGYLAALFFLGGRWFELHRNAIVTGPAFTLAQIRAGATFNTIAGNNTAILAVSDILELFYCCLA
jgi:hypothetical protein